MRSNINQESVIVFRMSSSILARDLHNDLHAILLEPHVAAKAIAWDGMLAVDAAAYIVTW